MVEILTDIFSHVCHQIPERSFLVYEGKSILCARCTGMYLGLLLSLIPIMRFSKISNIKMASMLVLSIFILILEIFGENTRIVPFGNTARFITGVIFGISVGIGIVMPAKQFMRGC